MEKGVILVVGFFLAIVAVILLVMIFAAIGAVVNVITHRVDDTKKYIQKKSAKIVKIDKPVPQVPATKANRVTTVEVKQRKNATTNATVVILNPVMVD